MNFLTITKFSKKLYDIKLKYYFITVKMTSIYDIPYKDIRKFLSANNKNLVNEDDAYNEVLILLKDKNSKGHTTSIIEWMIAHNLIVNKVIIPYYTVDDIDNMSQSEINKLAKKLTMKGNDRGNIKNILRYLHKLEDISLLPEIKDIIFNNLTQLELENINIYDLNFDNIINLLKTHRNKVAIRKFVSDNLDKIIIYQFLLSLNSSIPDMLELDVTKNFFLDQMLDLLYFADFYNKNIIADIIEDFRQGFLKYYTVKEFDDLIRSIKEKKYKYEDNIEIHISEMNNLVKFTIDLIKNNEIGLARKVVAIIKNLKYVSGHNNIGHNNIPYVYFLVDEINKLKPSLSTEIINNVIGSHIPRINNRY